MPLHHDTPVADREAKKPQKTNACSGIADKKPPKPLLAGGDPLGESGGLDDPDFEERAAIREFDGGLPRSEAEAQAEQEMPDIPDRRRNTGL